MQLFAVHGRGEGKASRFGWPAWSARVVGVNGSNSKGVRGCGAGVERRERGTIRRGKIRVHEEQEVFLYNFHYTDYLFEGCMSLMPPFLLTVFEGCV